MKRLIWGLAAGILLLIVCSTLRLERGLSPEFKLFYDQHKVIMEYKVPHYIDQKKPEERSYFLKLPPDKQRQYIKLFWEIREIGMEEEYKIRLGVVKKWFRFEGIDPWHTDLGRTMLLCGQPFDEQYRDQNGNPYNEGEELWNEARQAGKRWFRHWLYWHGQGFFQQVITITFEWDGLRWRYMQSADTLIQRFVEYWKFRMAPTDEGWELWGKQ